MSALTVTLTGPRFSANDRHHWARKAGLNQIWRETAYWRSLVAIGAATWEARVPLQRAHALVEVVPHNRGRVDPANVAPAAKAAVDGMVLAGLLVDDDAAHLLGPDFRLADQPVRQQRGMWTLRITVTDLADMAGEALRAPETVQGVSEYPDGTKGALAAHRPPATGYGAAP